jgi:hypothetical protein
MEINIKISSDHRPDTVEVERSAGKKLGSNREGQNCAVGCAGVHHAARVQIHTLDISRHIFEDLQTLARGLVPQRELVGTASEQRAVGHDYQRLERARMGLKRYSRNGQCRIREWKVPRRRVDPAGSECPRYGPTRRRHR